MPDDDSNPGEQPTLSELVGFFTGNELHKRSAETKTACPITYHENDHIDPGFFINDTKSDDGKGLYYCFKCPGGGHGEKLLRDVFKQASWEDAVDVYRKSSPISGSQTQKSAANASQARGFAGASRIALLRSRPSLQSQPAPRKYTASQLLGVLEAVAERFHRQLLKDLNRDGFVAAYVKNRKLLQAAPDFGLGYSGSFSKIRKKFPDDILIEAGIANVRKDGSISFPLQSRIIFPWRDEHGQVRGLTGRVIDNCDPKYMHSRSVPDVFKKSEHLWGIDLAKEAIDRDGRLIVVEGFTDVMALHGAGLKYVVSPIGVSISDIQLEKLFSLNDSPLVVLDGDRAGRDASVLAAIKALKYLTKIGPEKAKGKSLNFALLSDGKDPDEIIHGAGIEVFLKSIAHPLNMYQMSDPHEALKTGNFDENTKGTLERVVDCRDREIQQREEQARARRVQRDNAIGGAASMDRQNTKRPADGEAGGDRLLSKPVADELKCPPVCKVGMSTSSPRGTRTSHDLSG